MSENNTKKKYFRNDVGYMEEVYDRHSFLKKELDALFQLSSGRSTSLTPFITNQKGEISERKIQALIDKFVDCGGFRPNTQSLEAIRRLYPDEKEYKEHLQWRLDYEEWYRSFLYCAIKGIVTIDVYEFRPVRTFGDIITVAHNTSVSKTDIITEEYKYTDEYIKLSCSSDVLKMTRRTDFYDIMNYVYRRITGHCISETHTSEERELISEYIKELKEQYDDYVQQSVEWAEEYWVHDDGTAMTEEEIQAVNDAMYEDYCSNMPEPLPWEIERARKIKEFEKNARKSEEEWFSSLKNPEKFIRCYKKAREISFKYGGWPNNAGNYIEEMIDSFLCANGLSELADEDTAVDAVYEISRARKIIERQRRKKGIYDE